MLFKENVYIFYVAKMIQNLMFFYNQEPTQTLRFIDEMYASMSGAKISLGIIGMTDCGSTPVKRLPGQISMVSISSEGRDRLSPAMRKSETRFTSPQMASAAR